MLLAVKGLSLLWVRLLGEITVTLFFQSYFRYATLRRPRFSDLPLWCSASVSWCSAARTGRMSTEWRLVHMSTGLRATRWNMCGWVHKKKRPWSLQERWHTILSSKIPSWYIMMEHIMRTFLSERVEPFHMSNSIWNIYQLNLLNAPLVCHLILDITILYYNYIMI